MWLARSSRSRRRPLVRFLVLRRSSAVQTRKSALRDGQPRLHPISLHAPTTRVPRNLCVVQCRMRRNPAFHVERKSSELQTPKPPPQCVHQQHSRSSRCDPMLRVRRSRPTSSRPWIRQDQSRHVPCRARTGRQSSPRYARAPRAPHKPSRDPCRRQGLRRILSPNRDHNLRNSDPLRKMQNPSTRTRVTTINAENISDGKDSGGPEKGRRIFWR